MTNKKFSWRDRGNSFTYAFDGLKSLLRTEHNTWIHAALTIVVIIMVFILKVNSTECMLLIFAVAIVWITEILNTAIEKIMDFISLEKHPQIKLIKDFGAAATLVSSLAALLVGVIIFLPKIFNHV